MACAQIDRITLARDTERHKYDNRERELCIPRHAKRCENLGDEKEQGRNRSTFVLETFFFFLGKRRNLREVQVNRPELGIEPGAGFEP